MKLKSFRTNAAFMLTTLMLLVAAGTTVATAQTYTDLFNFNGTDGGDPMGTIAQGRGGKLYGTTESGGASYGVVFRVTPSGKAVVLYNFGGVHGANPQSGLTLGTDGSFYGTTNYGGQMSCNDGYGCGTIFKITPTGSLTTLYAFTDGTDGEGPLAPPVQGNDANFYGTTSWSQYGTGVAYKISASGSFTSLGPIPGQSVAPLLLATDGNFYGTTNYGGANSCGNGYYCGAVFKLTPKGIVTTVYNFDGTNGKFPWAPVIQGSDGNFYGTAYQGGSFGAGVVYKLTPQGAITVLHNFPDPNYPNDGSTPFAALVQATDGNFYGVTESGGSLGWGVIFQITLGGSYSILHNFDSIHGQNPYNTPPMQHTNGKIYGLATSGTGPTGEGVVYSLDMGLGPFVSLLPTSGKVGKTVEVLGQGLTGTTGLSFNGTPASYTVVSDTFLKTTVPSGATTGYLTVTTPSGTLTSNKEFQVKQ